MGLECLAHGWPRLRRIEKRIEKCALILNRDTDDVRLFDPVVSHLAGRRSDKTAHAHSLDLSRTPNHLPNVRREPCLDPRRANLFARHSRDLLSEFAIYRVK